MSSKKQYQVGSQMSEFACSSCGIQSNIEPSESVGAGHTVLQLQEGMLSQLFETQSDQQQQKIITILRRVVESLIGSDPRHFDRF
jgi:hypothetical protein